LTASTPNDTAPIKTTVFYKNAHLYAACGLIVGAVFTAATPLDVDPFKPIVDQWNATAITYWRYYVVRLIIEDAKGLCACFVIAWFFARKTPASLRLSQVMFCATISWCTWTISRFIVWRTSDLWRPFGDVDEWVSSPRALVVILPSILISRKLFKSLQ
jgi:hypothetical protein